jgi:hypothetical protein
MGAVANANVNVTTVIVNVNFTTVIVNVNFTAVTVTTVILTVSRSPVLDCRLMQSLMLINSDSGGQTRGRD